LEPPRIQDKTAVATEVLCAKSMSVFGQGSSAIKKLPPYLTVQMVRFFYKVEARQKAKILRKVQADQLHNRGLHLLVVLFLINMGWKQSCPVLLLDFAATATRLGCRNPWHETGMHLEDRGSIATGLHF
jgi:hypothetical protein